MQRDSLRRKNPCVKMERPPVLCLPSLNRRSLYFTRSPCGDGLLSADSLNDSILPVQIAAVNPLRVAAGVVFASDRVLVVLVCGGFFLRNFNDNEKKSAGDARTRFVLCDRVMYTYREYLS